MNKNELEAINRIWTRLRFFFLVLITLGSPGDMNPLAMKVAAGSFMMAIFWVTEAI